MLLFRGPSPDQDGYSAGLVQSVCSGRQSQERLLVGMHGRRESSVCLGDFVRYSSEYAVSPTPSHLGVLPSKQMLFSPESDALLGQRAGN